MANPNQPVLAQEGDGYFPPLAESATHQQPAVPKDSSSGVTVGEDELPQDNNNNERVILTEARCPEVLAYAFPTKKKWKILTVIFLVQLSMNLNASLPANAQKALAERFGVSDQIASSVCAVFLITYAFGCELWAPWSEEFGRFPIIQGSLFLVNLCCLGAPLSPSFGGIIASRALGGLFTAGGSVTLGIVADMFKADEQQFAVAFIVLSSVGGSIFGPIIGGFIETYFDHRWTFWVQLIVGVFVQAVHAILADETRATTLLDRHARVLRASGQNPKAYGPNEGKTWKEALHPKGLVTLWLRPFKMFVTDMIVLSLSLLSGFSDALIFMGFQSFGLVYEKWGFTPWMTGLTFLAIGIAYVLAYFSFWFPIERNKALLRQNPHSEYAKFESRLWWLLWTGPLLPIGLLIFAWTSFSELHWMGPIIGSAVIGIANFAIYMATIDYMVAAYGAYSSSATGGNGFARDFLAGILTFATAPYYNAFRDATGDRVYLSWANTTLAGISLILVVSAILVYFKGSALRKRSPFARRLAEAEENQVQLEAINN